MLREPSRMVVLPSRPPPSIPQPVIRPSVTSIQARTWLAKRIASAASRPSMSGAESGGGTS
jgi:hypothetical protein